ncbi:MAG: sulfotransferase domain-containing protein [Acidimicrobiales bacterium]|nr:sulfotransferase domain-containing protein [Acidimicrobiales bacterium]
MEDLTTDTADAPARTRHPSSRSMGPVPSLPTSSKRSRRTTASRSRWRPPGEEDVTSHLRKGVAGDWVNHFDAEHIEYFKAHYGDLLQFHYETSNDWVDGATVTR